MKRTISVLIVCVFIFNTKINAQKTTTTNDNTPVSNGSVENPDLSDSRTSSINRPILFAQEAKASSDGRLKIAKIGGDYILHVEGRALIGERSQLTGKDDNFRLAVDGKLVAKEVVVRIDNWADYVFTNNYRLMPLKELKKYLEKNKHLPGIDAAKELEANGLNLGEMQKKQMEKTEELYLYLIQLSEQVEQLKVENAALKKEMQELQK